MPIRLFQHRIFTVAVMALLGTQAGADASAQSPGERSPASLGWNEAALEKVFDYAKSLPTDSLLIVTEGQVVRSLGDVSKPYNVHSVRKALLSAVVGQHLGSGEKQIDLAATLEALGIDDEPGPLTPKQRQATALHLIKSISGINHLSAASAGMQADVDRRLGKDENVPGSKWAYNNWDYNALTTIFEKRTGLAVADAFKAGIADRIGLQDFAPKWVYYIHEPKLSQHRAAMFRLSARDMARFGQLYLGKGEWQGQRVLPAGWVERVTADHVKTGDPGLYAGHGYLWWVPDASSGLPAGSFLALGLGFQAIFVVPGWRTVIVHQADTTPFLNRVVATMREQNIDFNAAAAKIVEFCRDPASAETDFCRRDRFLRKDEFARLVALIAEARAQ